MTFSPALQHYLPAFENRNEPFLHVHALDQHKQLVTTSLNRGQFWELALKAAGLLHAAGIGRGDRQIHAFDGNRLEDLVFRLAATLLGSVPVTINWQADNAQQVRYKVQLTQAKAAVIAPDFELKAALSDVPAHSQIPIGALADAEPLDSVHMANDLDSADERIIIFTSGTTGQPKGASHSYLSYQTNAATFNGFLDLAPEDRLGAVVINPLHHANATAVSDWCLRRPHAVLHLLERYTTGFWELLVRVADSGFDRIAIPAVSRHFDFLEHLDQTNGLPLDQAQLKRALGRVTFLLGSAPVGPTTVKRLQHYADQIPTVRFGSTETCLQVMGIPATLDQSARLAAMKRGWNHGDGQTGYFIGRPHPPYTSVKIVAGITPGEADFMQTQPPGTPGYVVTRGTNLMTQYVNNPQATAGVMHDGWYTGLMDIGYYLINPDDGEEDFYWMSRESTMLIKGGANYAYDQINHELKSYLHQQADLSESDFDLAVVGLKIDSEHEDAACVTIQLNQPLDQARQDELVQMLLKPSKGAVSKGALPDHVRFAQIPRNFKGAVQAPELKKQFEAWLQTRDR